MDNSLLRQWAAKYIWWKTPEDALRAPDRIMAQVMELGDYDDVLQLVDEAGEDALSRVLQHADAGQFSPKSWAYWHYRLGLAKPLQLPEMPRRKVA